MKESEHRKQRKTKSASTKRTFPFPLPPKKREREKTNLTQVLSLSPRATAGRLAHLLRPVAHRSALWLQSHRATLGHLGPPWATLGHQQSFWSTPLSIILGFIPQDRPAQRREKGKGVIVFLVLPDGSPTRRSAVGGRNNNNNVDPVAKEMSRVMTEAACRSPNQGTSSILPQISGGAKKVL